MSEPVCPQCWSHNVTWSDPVPTGSNGCKTCGYIGPVREFHPPAELTREALAAHYTRRNVKRQLAEPGPSQLDIDRERFKPKPWEKQSPEPKRHFWWQDQ